MQTFRCPTCHQVIHTTEETWPPFFPFCSERCKLVDLGRWLNDSYLIRGKELGDEDENENGAGEGANEKSS